ncbi:copper amine oxidase N-terminal domain-containing protein [Paenibacillus filicis]|uniref:Copper amine oxidase N-terminal domain-containing protein n=1 Tax=Paenibacillus filicis TaxID=669464 RepID=A0ABU9DKH2_9BACL
MKKKHLVTLSLLLAALAAETSASAVDVSGTTIHIQFQDRQQSAQVDGITVPLESAAQIVEGSFYIPIRWLGQQLGMEVVWHEERRSIGLTTPHAYLEWDLERGTGSVNGTTSALADSAIVQDGTLLVKLSAIAPYMGVKYTFTPQPSRVDLTYVSPTDSAYRESVYTEDTQPNSRPITVFATDKASYRLGEPIHYIDLSYDPDAEGLPEYRWKGKEDAFFKPGTYPVTLEARDRHGNWSKPYTRLIHVTNESYLSEAEFPWYASPAGSLIRSQTEAWQQAAEQAHPLTSLLTQSAYRERVVSGENPAVRETGLLNKQTVHGYSRLVSHHINELGKTVELKTLVYNPDTSKSRTLRMTSQGEATPTLLHRTVAKEAVTDFMTQPKAGQEIKIGPGKTVALDSYKLEPGQGMASFKDIETDGPVQIGMVAAEENEFVQDLQFYPEPAPLTKEQEDALRVSEIRMDVIEPLKNLKNVSKWSVDHKPVSDLGTLYSIHYNDPLPTAIAMHVKDGYADGVLKVDGVVVPLPQGGLTDHDGAFLVVRTTGLESSVHIDWMAAPGSSSQVEWILYPLQKK